jgi:CCR4-NOT complex subunit CAF16
MHAISDGERRRVQLTMGLMAPWDVLFLDEVDCVGKSNTDIYSLIAHAPRSQSTSMFSSGTIYCPF